MSERIAPKVAIGLLAIPVAVIGALWMFTPLTLGLLAYYVAWTRWPIFNLLWLYLHRTAFSFGVMSWKNAARVCAVCVAVGLFWGALWSIMRLDRFWFFQIPLFVVMGMMAMKGHGAGAWLRFAAILGAAVLGWFVGFVATFNFIAR